MLRHLSLDYTGKHEHFFKYVSKQMATRPLWKSEVLGMEPRAFVLGKRSAAEPQPQPTLVSTDVLCL